MVLAIGMILSLVPVMAAASGDYSVGYAKITYPAKVTEEPYTISTTYFNASGAKASGTVGVRVASPNDDVFYYNMFNVGKDGGIDFSIQMKASDPEGKYIVEFENDVMGDRNYAYYYFYNDVQKAKDAFDADVKAATSFTDVAVQQKLASLADDMKLYSKMVLKNDKDFIPAYLNRVKALIEKENIKYNSDSSFAAAVDEATLLALFNAAKESDVSKRYIDILIADADLLDVLADSATKNIDKTVEKFKKFSGPVKTMVAGDICKGGYENFTLDSLVDRFVSAVSKVDSDDNSSSGGSSSGGSSQTVTGGGNSGTPIVIPPVNSVTNVFNDIDTTAYWWLVEPLQALYSAGYINGRTANTFAPGENITRAEYLKILLLELGLTSNNYTASFADVNANDWYYTYVAAGAALGIVNGRSATEFAPNDLITREEISVMTMRAVRVKNISLGTAGSSTPFTDQASIADYAVSDVLALKEAGIISGRDTGAFDPQANATRAEAVKILYGVYQKR